MAGTGGKDPPDRKRKEDDRDEEMEEKEKKEQGSKGRGDGLKPPPAKISNNRSDQYENYKYTKEDIGPFRIYVQINNRGEADCKINKFSVGSMLRRMEISKRCVLDMKYVGNYKLLLIVNNFQTANMLVDKINTAQETYKAYIPKHLVTISGVIHGIPLDISDEEILEEIECDRPVVNIKRLTKFNEDHEREPTTAISITFRANELPEFVRLYSCRTRVRPFQQKVTLCRKCLRFNHREANCKGKQRCMRCAKPHASEEEFQRCQAEAKCANCRSKDHLSSDPNCPEKKRQESIKKLMARKNVTYAEAVEQIHTQVQNEYELLEHADEFPKIDESYAGVAEKNYGWKNPLREQWIKTNLERKAIQAAVRTYKDDADKQKTKGKKNQERTTTNAEKLTAERNKIVNPQEGESSKAATSSFGTKGDWNSQQWQLRLKAVEDRAAAKIKAAEEKRQNQLMNFYADMVQMLEDNSVAKKLMNQCTKKHFNLTETILQDDSEFSDGEL